MIRKEEIASHISEYLQKHTHASDTLEGIAKWWVMSQQLDVSVSTVQKALAQLEASGVVIEKRGADGRTRYQACLPSKGKS
jgi:DNA-binding transcriptional regulator YhcF (GntR family)